MPELPEVETIKETLRPLIGRRLLKQHIMRTDIIKKTDFDQGELVGQYIEDVQRRGKYLTILFTGQLSFVVHLGMSGRLYHAVNGSHWDKHVHYVAELDEGTQLIYRDPRRFGGIWLLNDRASFFAPLGVEPLSDSFHSVYLAGIVQKRKIPIKNLLLNQHLVAGIGNIYADEALFSAGIRPQRPAGDLTPEEIKRLAAAVKKTLIAGISYRGTTLRDYRDGDHQSGGFQEHLQVYGRKGEPCIQCGGLLRYDRVGGRGTHYCQHCQH